MTVLLGQLWALPTSLLGALLGLVGAARPKRLDGPERAWVWHVERGPLAFFFRRWRAVGPRGIGAQTIGAVILVVPECDPRLLAHERCHVRQAFALGPLYVPVYFALSAWAWFRGGDAYRDNPLEVAARKATEE